MELRWKFRVKMVSPIAFSALFIGVSILATFLPSAVGQTVVGWALLSALLTPLAFAWNDLRIIVQPTIRVRLCSLSGLILASIGWVLFIVGRIHMGIVQEQRGSFFAGFEDWGFDAVRWAALLSVIAVACFVGAARRLRRRGLISSGLLFVLTWGVAMSL